MALVRLEMDLNLLHAAPHCPNRSRYLFVAVEIRQGIIQAQDRPLGAEIGFLGVWHTSEQNLLHRPHIHFLVPASGIAPDGQHWIACRAGFLLPVRVLSHMFRGKFLHYWEKTFTAGELTFFSAYRHLQEPAAFRRYLAPVWNTDWVFYAKRPFAGPAQVLDYVGRYTHASPSPDGFHRIRYFGFLGIERGSLSAVDDPRCPAIRRMKIRRELFDKRKARGAETGNAHHVP